MLTISEIACLHAPEEIEILIDASITVRTILAHLGQGSSERTDLLSGEAVDIGMTPIDQLLGKFVQSVEIVGCVVKVVTPIEAEPLDRFDDGIDILLIFFFRIGVIETEVTDATVITGKTEVKANALGMTDMEVSIRFRWESSLNPSSPLT